MDFSDLTRDEWIQVLIYGSLGLYLATSIPRLFRGRVAAGVASLAVWVGLLLATLVAYSYRFELQDAGQRVVAVVFPGTIIETGPKQVTIFRRPDGQFTVKGSVGERSVSFVLDTGASTVVLRAEDAERLGLPMRRLTFDVPVSTANGHASAAAVTLPDLKIGGIVERNVEALVARPGSLHGNLLGMSFLTRLESFTFSNDKLVMHGS